MNAETGRRPLTFKLDEGFTDMPMQVPCGKCIGCYTDIASMWATRCRHEGLMSKDSWFLTLTYTDASLPRLASLHKSHLQLFWKRLRKGLSQDGIKYFAAGEYGDVTERPHYHTLLFHCNIPDVDVRMHGDKRVYVSRRVEELWGWGNIWLEPFTAATATYVTRYIVKAKQKREDWYQGRAREFHVMSRRPGLGASYIDKYYKSVYPRGIRTPGGGKAKTPRYYDERVAKTQPQLVTRTKQHRRDWATSPQALDKQGSRAYTVEEVRERTANFWKGASKKGYD